MAARGLGLAASARLARSPLATTSRPAPAVRGTDRDGFVLSDGSGALVLEELEHAPACGADLCRAGWLRHERRRLPHDRALPEDGAGAARCMKNALRDAGLDPRQVDYINAHGTSTLVATAGDRAAEERVRRACPCAVDEFDQVDDRPPVGCRRCGGGDLQRAGPARPGRPADHQPGQPGRRLRPRPGGPRSQAAQDRRGPVELAGFGGTNGTLVFRRFAD